MPLQKRNQIWQSLEQGAGKRCLECAYSAAQSCQCLYSAFHSTAEENPKRRTFSLRLVAKNNVRQASVEAVVQQGTLVFSSHLLSQFKEILADPVVTQTLNGLSFQGMKEERTSVRRGSEVKA